MNCNFIKKDNNKCKAKPMKGAEYCFNHHPEYRNSKMKAVTKGCLNRRLIIKYGESIKLKNARDIKDLISETINLVWTGKMPCSQPANSIGFLSRVFLDAYEQSDLDSRITRLEEKTKQ